MIEGPFSNRQDADHVLRTLPQLGGPESADPRFIAAVEAWDPDAGQGGLVFMGPTGCGKTTAAVYLVRRHLALRENATSTAFMIARDLANDPELQERARRVRLLVLDDLGKEHDPRNVIFGVLDYRHTRFPTVVTTGLRADDLDRNQDGALTRRIAEFQGKRVQMVSVFASKPRLVPDGKRPPGDQEELARRTGEKL